MLIASANVAVLLLALADARGREIGLRQALGASPARLFRQLITESAMLAVAGAVVALIAARWLIPLLPALLPVAGYVAFGENPLGNLRYALLPALTMGLPIAAVQMRFLRSSMLDVVRQDYVRTARSKGLPERLVIYRHALRNALIPFLSILGLEAGFLLGGSVIVEQIFSWPGIGWLMIQSITQRDYPIVQGAVLLSAFVFVTINLLVDVGYAVLDPRIRLET